MNFNKHSDLVGLHAFLSPSKYHWVNYSPEKLDKTYRQSLAAQKGVILHQYAETSISLNQKLPRTKQTLNMFVNDAIGFGMTPEVILYYSPNAFGTADAISFRRRKLRIHDLKTGVTPVSFLQLEVYAALFCLEYKKQPFDIDMELRIYQNDEINIHIPDPASIQDIMTKIISYDKLIEIARTEEGFNE